MTTASTRTRLCLCGVAVALATGCLGLGPKAVTADRFDYSTAVADSWKQQTLLNIVKLRYMDLPVFVDVASIVAGYSLETTGSVGSQFSSESATGNSLLIGASGKFTDRPTITYVPLTGERFLRGLMTPIDPKSIFSMLQSGYAADFVLNLTVESLNGVRNRSATAGAVREADPEFTRAMKLLREVQAAGAVGVRVEEDPAKASTAVLFFRREDVAPEILEKTAEIRRLLKMSPEPQRFTLVYSPVRGADNELAVGSRSMLQIMMTFSTYMDVPQEHLDDHSAVPSLAASTPEGGRSNSRIHCSPDRPESAFVAIRYRDQWFWIENGDWEAKRALTAIIFFFTLADTGSKDQLPMITIPAQ